MQRSYAQREIAAWPMARLLRGLTAFCLLAAVSHAGQIQVVNLVTNDQLANPAQITDGNLKNAWGISHSAASPFWVSANGSGLSALYSVNPVTNATAKVGLEVTIPGDGSVTGQVFNAAAGTGAFNNNFFLFVSEDGTISGWRGALGTTAEILQSPSDAVYKGTTIVTTGGNAYLLSANFHAGTIDVLKGNAGAPELPGDFTDPNLPANYAPFNIERIGNDIFVTYAMKGAGGEETIGAGLGIVNRFRLDGTLQARVGIGGTLNAPWGLALAPSSFEGIAGDLLVGNFGDGTINIFNLDTNSFVGQLLDVNDSVIKIDGLWALSVGNDAAGGSSSKVYFSAGPNNETNGVFGVLQVVPEPASIVMAVTGGLMLLSFARRTRDTRYSST